MPAPVASLIVPVHNGLAYLEAMIRTLREHTPPGMYELILSDDASDESTRRFLEEVEGATRLRSDLNAGFAATCNRGATAATTNNLIFLNSDLEFTPGWLDAFLRASQEPVVGAVGAKLLYPDGTIQHGGIFLREDRLDRVPLIASHDHVGKPGDDPEANRKQDLLAVTAASVFVKRGAFEKAGGFDEGYVNGYEDVDLCLKIRELGLRVVYDPAVELIHHESKSGAKRFAASKQNQRRFLERWSGRVRPEVLVSEFLEVGPHPDASVAQPFYAESKAVPNPAVRIVVVPNGITSAMAATLESVFGARIGLEDAVVAVCGPGDRDTAEYLRLCDGFDDVFGTAGSVDEALGGGTEPFVAIVEAGTILTQGWLARLIRHLEKSGADAVGPLMTEVLGAQNAMSYLASGSGTVHPNELTHLFARHHSGRSQPADSLHSACVLRRREAISGSKKRVVALDVFVHRDARFLQPLRQAA